MRFIRDSVQMFRDNPDMVPVYWGLIGVTALGLAALVGVLFFSPPWG